MRASPASGKPVRWRGFASLHSSLVDYPNLSNGIAAAAIATAARRALVKRSPRKTTAMRIAKTALVSRRAAEGAMGATLHTQRINR